MQNVYACQTFYSLVVLRGYNYTVIVIGDTMLLTRVLYYGIIVKNYRFVRGRNDPSGIPFPAIKQYTFLAIV